MNEKLKEKIIQIFVFDCLCKKREREKYNYIIYKYNFTILKIKNLFHIINVKNQTFVLSNFI